MRASRTHRSLCCEHGPNKAITTVECARKLGRLAEARPRPQQAASPSGAQLRTQLGSDRARGRPLRWLDRQARRQQRGQRWRTPGGRRQARPGQQLAQPHVALAQARVRHLRRAPRRYVNAVCLPAPAEYHSDPAPGLWLRAGVAVAQLPPPWTMLGNGARQAVAPPAQTPPSCTRVRLPAPHPRPARIPT